MFLEDSKAFPRCCHVREKINILFFILKLEWFRSGSYALLVREHCSQPDWRRARAPSDLPGVVTRGFSLGCGYGNGFLSGQGLPWSSNCASDLAYSCNWWMREWKFKKHSQFVSLTAYLLLEIASVFHFWSTKWSISLQSHHVWFLN